VDLPVPLAALLQSGFNQLLKMDEDGAARIAQLQGKLVRMQLRGVEINAWILFLSDRVEVLEHYDAEPDVTISGGPFSMLAVATGQRKIFDGGVEVSGDVEVANKFNRLLQTLDIDWEEHLSRLTGDMFARKLGLLGSGVQQWAGRNADAMQSNVAEYMRDEKSHLPHDWEIDEFLTDVDDLRDRVAMLEARINALFKG